jgi:hypothetical protein
LKQLMALLAAAAGSAAVMYYFDPDMGRRRRERLLGAAHFAPTRLHLATIGDGPLRDDVRARVGSLVSHPGAIDVSVEDGVVRLSGAVLSQEMDGLLTQVRDMRGVRRVINALNAHDSPRRLAAAR